MDIDNRNGDLKDRTYQYSLNVATICRQIQGEEQGKKIADMLFEKSTSIGLTARLAFKGRSNNDFKDKLRQIINDADECIFWFDMLIDLGIVEESAVEELMVEASELIAIFISISKKSRSSY